MLHQMRSGILKTRLVLSIGILALFIVGCSDSADDVALAPPIPDGGLGSPAPIVQVTHFGEDDLQFDITCTVTKYRPDTYNNFWIAVLEFSTPEDADGGSITLSSIQSTVTNYEYIIGSVRIQIDWLSMRPAFRTDRGVIVFSGSYSKRDGSDERYFNKELCSWYDPAYQ